MNDEPEADDTVTTSLCGMQGDGNFRRQWWL